MTGIQPVRVATVIVIACLALTGCHGATAPAAPTSTARNELVASDAVHALPDWIANPPSVPQGLLGTNNCTIPLGPNATGGIWNFHEDGACWERQGPDGWLRQHQNAIHVPEHVACGGGPADVSPIRICRAGGQGQPTPCEVNPTTGPLGCAVCVRSVVCH